jgi:adenylosuccinate lyase
MPRAMTFFMDQISEHQRDLSNSASQRFTADYIAGFAMAVSRMISVVEGLGADRERLLFNLRGGAAGSGGISGGVLAEPAYILLAEAGVSDAHEVIRKITLKAEKEGLSFACALAADSVTLKLIAGKMVELGIIKSETEVLSFFEKPESYRGLAAEKARSLAVKYRQLMNKGEKHAV